MTDKSLTLFEMTGELAELQNLAADPDADPESFGLALEALAGDVKEKSLQVAQVSKNLAAAADAIKAYKAGLDRREKALRAREKDIRAYILACLSRSGISKVESPYLALTVKRGPARLEIVDEAAIPDDYRREEFISVPDKEKIKAALKAGETVPGCRLVQEDHVMVR